MTQHLRSLFGLFTAVVVLLIGHGLQLTLLPLKAEALGWSTTSVGLLGSVYFFGFLIGCMTVPLLVTRVGHIRVFTILTAIAAAALLGTEMNGTLPGWMALRFITGWSISGLYLVIESWLNETMPSESRGLVLGLYTVVVLAAMAGGQLLLSTAPLQGPDLVILGALFLLLAAVPVGLTRGVIPGLVPAFEFSLRRLFQISHAATVCVLLSGMVTGVLWTVLPAFLRQTGFNAADIGSLMGIAIVGGALSQIPLGRLSDRIDRRAVIFLVMLLGALLCAIAAWRATFSFVEMAVIVGLLGAFTMPIYALALAHANDNTRDDFLVVGTGILLLNSIGSMIGPLAVSEAVAWQASRGFFGYCALCLGLGALYALAMMLRRPALRVHYEPFAATSRTTQGAVEIDPRAEH